MTMPAVVQRLPLFYQDPVLLRFEEHGDAGLASRGDFGFARKAVAIPLCIGEFAAALRHFPIVFAMDGQASPIALVGIRQDNNLFVEQDGGWKAGSYMPAYVRRYPFIVTETTDKSLQMLAVDRASERYVPSVSGHAAAERVFNEAGGPSAAAQSAIAFCQAYGADSTRSIAFGRALMEAHVLAPYHADFRLPDGSRHQVNGFHAVDEKAYRALPATTLADWHANGWLDLVTLHLASLQSFQNLLDLDAQRTNAGNALA